jgi:hypothetical protein
LAEGFATTVTPDIVSASTRNNPAIASFLGLITILKLLRGNIF